MKVVLFGATGMVGQGVLRECLSDDAVSEVLVVGRQAVSVEHPKLRQITRENLVDLSTMESELAGYDACFFCLGVSSQGMKEKAYREVTYDLTLSIAQTFAAVNPQKTFIYVSGAGTDSTGNSRLMWARVKGETENALFALPLTAVMFRPGYIQPGRNIVSKTKLYRTIYAVIAPLYPLLRRILPKYVTSNEEIGRAMIRIAKDGVNQTGTNKPILGNVDINQLAAG